MQNLRREPVLISTIVGNILAIAIAFGFSLSMEQTAAIIALTNTITAIFFGRPNVTPNVSVVARDDNGMTVAGDASPIQNGMPVIVKSHTEANVQDSSFDVTTLDEAGVRRPDPEYNAGQHVL